MRKDIAEKWIAALESGEYKQTTGKLRDEKGFCCLGVLCNLHAQEHPKIAKKQKQIHKYLSYSATLPDAVMKWAGIKSDNGNINDGAICLAEINDSGSSFKHIAKLIKKNIDKL